MTQVKFKYPRVSKILQVQEGKEEEGGREGGRKEGRNFC